MKRTANFWKNSFKPVEYRSQAGTHKESSRKNTNLQNLLAKFKSCSSARDLERAKELHAESARVGNASSIYVANAVMNMYAKCGSMVMARQVFDNLRMPSVVSWNIVILGYAENGQGLTALNLFKRMRSQGCAPNSRTIVAALKACTSLAVNHDRNGMLECREWGKQIHMLASELGGDSIIYVQNSLIDMYAKSGNMAEALKVFNSISHPDVVSWNALILGYASNDEAVTALDTFTRMRSQGCAPNAITLVSVLKACGLLAALEFGKMIHADIDEANELDVLLVTALVDFYARCGSLEEARRVFNSHCKTRDLTTWNALLVGYSRLGDIESVSGLFQGLQDAGFQPDAITFTGVLACCSHAGLVERGKEHFELMSRKYAVTPTVEHFTCMVDMLGRSNKLEESMQLLCSMHCEPDAVTWMTLLAACRKWKNVEIGRLAFRSLVSLDGTNAAAYALLSDIYASRGMWEEQEIVLGMRRKCVTWKMPGRSWWMDDTGQVHSFLVDLKDS